MRRRARDILGSSTPRQFRRNHLAATRTRTPSGDGPYRFIAREEALCRLRRNEGRSARDLWPRVDMNSLACGMWLRLLERLVGPEAHDGQPEGVHRQFIVLYDLAEDIGNAGGPSFPLEFRMICRIRVHLLELDASRIR